MKMNRKISRRDFLKQTAAVGAGAAVVTGGFPYVGALTVVIRLWGGLPEGVMYAILLANGMTPMINRLTQPRVYGVAKKA